MAMGVGARRITRSGTAGRPSDWPDPAGRYGRRRSRCVSVLRAAFPSAARRRARRMTGLSVSSRVRTECSPPPLECAMPSVSTIRKHPRPHTSAGPPPPFLFRRRHSLGISARPIPSDNHHHHHHHHHHHPLRGRRPCSVLSLGAHQMLGVCGGRPLRPLRSAGGWLLRRRVTLLHATIGGFKDYLSMYVHICTADLGRVHMYRAPLSTR